MKHITLCGFGLAIGCFALLTTLGSQQGDPVLAVSYEKRVAATLIDSEQGVASKDPGKISAAQVKECELFRTASKTRYSRRFRNQDNSFYRIDVFAKDIRLPDLMEDGWKKVAKDTRTDAEVWVKEVGGAREFLGRLLRGKVLLEILQRDPPQGADTVLGRFELFVANARANGLFEDQPIELVDGNAQFTGKVVLPLKDPADKTIYHTLATSKEQRRGACAEEVSLLVLRAHFPQPGKVTLRLPGVGEHGRLLTLTGAPARLVATKSEKPNEQVLDLETREVLGPKGVPLKEHYAFALYAPPVAFVDGSEEKPLFVPFGKNGQLQARSVPVHMDFQPKSGMRQQVSTDILVVRPPVVLVHGTYDAPYSCWDTPWFGGKTMVERLQELGFAVWLVDYRQTNGKSGRGVSTFAHNAKVVWHNENDAQQKSRDREIDGKDITTPMHCEPGGIKVALEEFRRQGLAATRADVVGHSMGGVLPRVYASDNYTKGWYRRPENFHKGDINRLVTVSSTHFGSDIQRILMRYEEEAPRSMSTMLGRLSLLSPILDYGSRRAVLELVDYTAGIQTGAFADQRPGGAALRKIGATPLPAHAIGCVAGTGDFDIQLPPEVRERLGNEAADNLLAAEKLYYVRLALLLGLSRKQVLKSAFEKEKQPQDVERLLRLEQELNEIWDDFADNIFHIVAYWDTIDAVTHNGLQIMVQIFRAMVFGNCRNDVTVREQSSHGGLAPPHVTSLQGVLHGYAPAYKSVQDRVVELLSGGMSPFERKGFPEAGQDINAFNKIGGLRPPAKAPDLIGKSIAEARQMVLDLDLVPVFVRGARSTDRPNTVYRQDPAPGTEVIRLNQIRMQYYRE